MKALFLDCNDQLAPIFAQVHGADDPPIDVNMAPAAIAPADLRRLLAGTAICIVDHSYLPTAAITQCRDLRHVVFLGTGAASYMDIAALRGLGVAVHTIGGYGDTAVAEHTVALIFACARDIAMMDRQIRGGIWQSREGMQLHGKTLGIVGIGGIGREVARIARGIGMKVIAWNRTPRADAGIEMVELDALLAQADIVSLHLVLNDETRGLIDARHLARIKPGAILVNTARGALVDEAALYAALASGRLGHAGLDVFHDEPLRPDHSLALLPNVTMTPHAAFCTREASETLLRRAIDIVRHIVTQSDGG